MLTLNAGNEGFDHTWQDGSKSSTFTVTSPGLYSVMVTNGICIAEDAVQVDYKEKPVFSLGEDKELCAGNTLILGGLLESIYAYVWEDGSTSPTRTILQPGTFRITGSNACGSFTDEIIVRPGGCVLGVLAVPNAFTPNSDGTNDVFRISNTEQLSSFSMQVFNRWGQKIFESRDQAKGWDGRLGSRACDPGSYAYVIHYRQADGTPMILKGMVTLIR